MNQVTNLSPKPPQSGKIPILLLVFSGLALVAIFMVWLLAQAFFKEVAYTFPTDTVKFPARSTWDKSVSKRYGLSVVKALPSWDRKSQKLFSPLLIAQAVLVFQGAAQGRTFDSISHATGLDQAQLIDSRDAHTAVHSQLSKSSLRTANGLFMIWPIMLTKEFQYDAALNYGMDIVKLGSAGQGAQGTLDRWLKRKTGLSGSGFIKLGDKRMEMELYQALSLSLTVDAKTASAGGLLITGVQAPGGGYIIPLSDGFTLTVGTESQAATLRSPATYRHLRIPMTINLKLTQIETVIELQPSFAKSGLAGLFAGSNDLRNMSIELDTGKIGVARQKLKLNLIPGPGTSSEKADAISPAGGIFEVWYRDIPVPILVGILP